MSEGAKREWWIDPEYSAKMGEPAIASTREQLCLSDSIVHVIEHSAYEALLTEARALAEELKWYSDEKNVGEETAAHGELIRERNTIDGPGECYWEPDYGCRADKALTRFRTFLKLNGLEET